MLDGIVMLVREEQLVKAYAPMLVRLDGSVTLVRASVPLKAKSGISSVQLNSMLQPLPTGPAVFSPAQPENTLCPMVTVAAGIVTLISAPQSLKAYWRISVTLEGIVTPVSALQPEKA